MKNLDLTEVDEVAHKTFDEEVTQESSGSGSL